MCKRRYAVRPVSVKTMLNGFNDKLILKPYKHLIWINISGESVSVELEFFWLFMNLPGILAKRKKNKHNMIKRYLNERKEKIMKSKMFEYITNE